MEKVNGLPSETKRLACLVETDHSPQINEGNVSSFAIVYCRKVSLFFESGIMSVVSFVPAEARKKVVDLRASFCN